jgi:hypothetical protein
MKLRMSFVEAGRAAPSAILQVAESLRLSGVSKHANWY